MMMTQNKARVVLAASVSLALAKAAAAAKKLIKDRTAATADFQ